MILGNNFFRAQNDYQFKYIWSLCKTTCEATSKAAWLSPWNSYDQHFQPFNLKLLFCPLHIISQVDIAYSSSFRSLFTGSSNHILALTFLRYKVMTNKNAVSWGKPGINKQATLMCIVSLNSNIPFVFIWRSMDQSILKHISFSLLFSDDNLRYCINWLSTLTTEEMPDQVIIMWLISYSFQDLNKDCLGFVIACCLHTLECQQIWS